MGPRASLEVVVKTKKPPVLGIETWSLSPHESWYEYYYRKPLHLCYVIIATGFRLN